LPAGENKAFISRGEVEAMHLALSMVNLIDAGFFNGFMNTAMAE
jgi:hypothetical protein